MLTTRELATVRAALLYWQEEMCPHPAAMPPYFQVPLVQPLTEAETIALRARFADEAVRYGVCDPPQGNVLGQMYSSAELATQAAGGHLDRIWTIIV